MLKNNNSENIIYSFSVIAIAGIGLIQNANHDFEWVMGSETMMDYYPRILLSQNEVTTDTNQEILPTLTIISLGGNDYNHQNGNVPSQEEFTQGKIIKISISAAAILEPVCCKKQQIKFMTSY